MVLTVQATFNLGYMHHIGVGLEKDFAKAKRYYESVMEMSPKDAYFPAVIALGALVVDEFLAYLAGMLL